MSWISYCGAEAPFSLNPSHIIIFSSRTGPTGLPDIGNTGLAQCCRDGWVPVLFMRCSQETAKRKRNWKLSRTRVGSAVPVRAIQWCTVYTEGTELGEEAKCFVKTRNNKQVLGNCPTWRTNSFQCIYLFIVLYMFRACHAHHQEKQIVSIQLTVYS